MFYERTEFYNRSVLSNSSGLIKKKYYTSFRAATVTKDALSAEPELLFIEKCKVLRGNFSADIHDVYVCSFLVGGFKIRSKPHSRFNRNRVKATER